MLERLVSVELCSCLSGAPQRVRGAQEHAGRAGARGWGWDAQKGRQGSFEARQVRTTTTSTEKEATPRPLCSAEPSRCSWVQGSHCGTGACCPHTGGSSTCVGAGPRTACPWAKEFNLSLGSTHASGTVAPLKRTSRASRYVFLGTLVGGRLCGVPPAWLSGRGVQNLHRSWRGRAGLQRGSCRDPISQGCDRRGLLHSRRAAPKCCASKPREGGVVGTRAVCLGV